MTEHFEHFQRNEDCPSSHVARQTQKKNSVADYDIDDAKAFEGYAVDRSAIFLHRNQSLVAKCKERDDFTCQACGFRLKK